MKNIIFLKTIILLVSAGTLFVGCEKESIPFYEQSPGVYFDGASHSYSFVEDPGVTEKTINLPVLISGNAIGHDREISITAVRDTNTTASDAMYEVMDGIVLADAYSGLVPIKLKLSEELNDTIVNVRIEIQQSSDFEELNLGSRVCDITFTAKIIKPANWGWLRYYFGTPFSTRWWKFIMEHTDMTSIPYYPNHPDKETWWLDSTGIKAYQAMVRLALTKYNETHAEPLRHDDGDYAGEVVSMP